MLAGFSIDWFNDGWTGLDCYLEFDESRPLELVLYIPKNENMPTVKRVGIYMNNQSEIIEIARGEFTYFTLPVSPTGPMRVQIYADYKEINANGDERCLGVVLHVRGLDGSAVALERMFRVSGALRPTLPHREREIVQRELDVDFYLSHFSGAEAPADPVLHFLTLGWTAGRDPTPGFSVTYYLNRYRDIYENRLNPFVHYLIWGRKEGRQPQAFEEAVKDQPIQPPTESELASVVAHFNPVFYRRCYDDVAGTDAELLVHYMTKGWREGRDPGPDFSTRYYLDTYPDISRGGINPLLHYALYGRIEGRRCTERRAIPLMQDAAAVTVPQHLRGVQRAPGPDERPVPPARINPRSLHIHWVVPDFTPGSGGHMTIFRMVRHLEVFGHRCSIWIESPDHHKTAEQAHDTIVKNFQCVGAEVRFLSEGFFSTSGDAVIATGWTTAYAVAAATGFGAKYYFVQDHEPEFFPTGTEAILARGTYALDLACICASPWLDELMQGYGRWARHFFLSFDEETYRVLPRAEVQAAETGDRPVRIAVYARDHTARRCVALALMALDTLAATGENIEVHFYGQARLPFMETRYPAFSHGVLDAAALAELYNDCDIGICFSATNYSLVPQEMMACGLPVLELDVPSTRRIFPSGVVTLGGPQPGNIADRLRELVRDPARRRAQSQAGLEWVSQFSWEGAARAVEAAVVERLRELAPKRLSAPAVARSRDIAMDVIIPTWKGMKELPPVIEALRRQTDRASIQIHAIDSSSPDGTADWLRKQPDISLTVIDQKDFQHGRTRNLGASLGRAPLIAFLTQDAMPATAYWSHDIRQMFAHYPQGAGLFGRHIAYPHHPSFVREEIETHFANMLKHPLAMSKHTDPARWEANERGWRQLLHFYSDNNSAMRRDIWKEIPYPEVDYGEDQVWARDIIEAGHVKLYAPTATVYHSHDYGPKETYDRARTEGHFFFKYFGYRLGDGTPDALAMRISNEQSSLRAKAARRNMDEQEMKTRLANIEAKYHGWRDGLAMALDSNRHEEVLAS